MISAWVVLIASLSYLALLFLLAWLAERGTIPLAVARHPITYTLSLGVYATSWSYYGSVGLAQDGGFLFLTIYIGLTVAMGLTPVLLQPIFRLVRDYQLSSLADLFAFRYRKTSVGPWVTAAMLMGSIPYLSLQIRAGTQSVQMLTHDIPTDTLALAFCTVLTVFAVLFGARHLTPRDQHEGLVVAIAFESAVKLIALLSVGLFAIVGVFGGFAEFDQWIDATPEAIDALYDPVKDGSWLSMMVLSFCAAFLLPRQFHMMFTENHSSRSLRVASWAFPLYLLLLNLPIIPILWAGQTVAPGISADLYVMAVSMVAENSWLPLFALIGGMSAASAMMIVATLSLSSMVLNHWIAPAGMTVPQAQHDFYRALLWSKRVSIVFIILCAYGFFKVIQDNAGLAQMGLISFVAVAQLLPGMVGLLFWGRATSNGFLLGLAGGFLMWFVILIMPLLVNSDILDQQIDLSAIFGAEGSDIWAVATFWTLTTNAILLVLGSYATRPSNEEVEAAELCVHQGTRPLTGTVLALSPYQFSQQLEEVMGPSAAEKEVDNALQELKLDWQESRPAELRRLREHIELNLSGLLGPTLARLIVNDRLRLHKETHAALSDSFKRLEMRLENSRNRLRGAERELDEMRRYHRDVLQELPIGVCSLDTNNTIVIWNTTMAQLSGIAAGDALGQSIEALRPPWGKLLFDFAKGDTNHLLKQRVRGDNGSHSYNFHKSSIQTSAITPEARNGLVILLEDRTNIDLLEAELAHSERLASIGRFAAGVAHEIGNPLTGIDSLAQNLAHENDPNIVLQTGDNIIKQTRRINEIVKSLLAFSRREAPSEGSRDLFELAHCITEAIDLIKLDPSTHRIRFSYDCLPTLFVHADRQKILQMIVNLLSNASAASSDNSDVDVRAHGMGSSCIIEVIDQGSGIENDVQTSIFEPFYTTKAVGKGTGLGLSLVHSIVEEHAGRITLDSSPGNGSCFRITLPGAVLINTKEHNAT